tara:strand:- start:136 stop:240 length:105 start_codon:yes stop_codon:yes gene_type:complete
VTEQLAGSDNPANASGYGVMFDVLPIELIGTSII